MRDVSLRGGHALLEDDIARTPQRQDIMPAPLVTEAHRKTRSGR